jgi:hypothetical protein
VAQAVSYGDLLAHLGGPLPVQGEEDWQVIEHLVRNAAPGIVGSSGPRYFGFVVGGVLPASLAAD